MICKGKVSSLPLRQSRRRIGNAQSLASARHQTSVSSDCRQDAPKYPPAASTPSSDQIAQLSSSPPCPICTLPTTKVHPRYRYSCAYFKVRMNRIPSVTHPSSVTTLLPTNHIPGISRFSKHSANQIVWGTMEILRSTQ
jgi:hypothetical protein